MKPRKYPVEATPDASRPASCPGEGTGDRVGVPYSAGKPATAAVRSSATSTSWAAVSAPPGLGMA